MALTLVPPTLSDAEALFDFERENRAFFEAAINARPASYYSIDGVTQAVARAIRDAEDGIGYQCLVKDEGGRIVGRINLSSVRRAHFHSAVLGYRIGEAACGRGYAGEAVRQILALAFGELGLLRIEADCRRENAASSRILLRNGFTQFGHSRRSFELQGVWYDRLHFECHAPAA
jgi:ribosomal-protein-alanine N-acetyltransferase